VSCYKAIMMMSKHARVALAGFAALCGALSARAEYEVSNTGLWPTNWPKELDPLREQSRTLRHNEMDIHEIPFTNRLQFEAAWTHILAVKSPEAPITLLKGPDTWLGGTMQAGVRIRAPLTGTLVSPEGSQYLPGAEALITNIPLLRIGPPWSDDLKSKSGAVPEFVVYDNGRWVPCSVTNRTTNSPVHGRLIQRARTDIELIVDGDIVDVNRISVPADSLVVDKRFSVQSAVGSQPTVSVTPEPAGSPQSLTGTVRIQLADDEGKAVAFEKEGAAQVFIQDATKTGIGSWGGCAAVSKNGACEFKNVPPGKYLVATRLVATPEGPTIDPELSMSIDVKAMHLTEARALYRPR